MLQMQSCDLHFLPPSYVNAQKVQHFAVALLTLFSTAYGPPCSCHIGHVLRDCGITTDLSVGLFFFFPLSQLIHLRPIGEVHDQPELHQSTACASRSDCTFGVCDPSRVFEGKFSFILKCGFLI